jgi:hypothetical protein
LRGSLHSNAGVTAIVVAALAIAGVATNHGRVAPIDESGYEPNVAALDGLLDRFDGFGKAVAVVGDLDGNGVPDLVVGAPGDDDIENGGAVWVLFLGPTGSLQSVSKISPTQGGFETGPVMPALGLGTALSGAADLDRDGIPDFAIGDAWGPGGIFDRGQLWLVRTRADGTVKLNTRIHGSTPPPPPEPGCAATTTTLTTTTTAISPTPTTTTTTPSDSLALPYYYQDEFAASLDVMTAGVPEGARMAVGAPGTDSGGCEAGAVWLIDLDANGDVAGSDRIVLDDSELRAAFGSAVAWLGDIDGDGTIELAVSEPYRGEGFGPVTDGVVWLLSIAADRSVAAAKTITSDVVGLGPHHRFGLALAAVGDVDGDGTPDLAVSDFWDPTDLFPDDGVIWILFLLPNGTVKGFGRIAVTDAPVASVIGEERSGRGFGASLAGTGDLDGDLIPDLAIGVPRYTASARKDPGAVLIAYMDATGAVKHVRRITDESAPGPTTTIEGPTTTVCAHFCGTSSTTTTTTTLGEAVCGDAAGGGDVNSTDALAALQSAVGLLACPSSICDVDCSGSVSAVDALRILQAAIGAQILDCSCG